ncbi:MAG: TonB-dependent receptor [Verrucomicrobia bacterium]|nr:TonB-dependent receptor [Verrucomicrobiota bacterium]
MTATQTLRLPGRFTLESVPVALAPLARATARLFRRVLPLVAFLIAFTGLVIAPSAHAQSAAFGSVTGRVLNPLTGKYVANAEIRVAGSEATAVTDDEGRFQLTRVPVGTAAVTVSFSGYHNATATVDVLAGQTATKDFEIVSSDTPMADGTVKMEAFTVSSEREGNAKAIMAQRNSMNITNSVSADVFGTTSEGNVGEFLKYLPGVDLEYVEADTRTPRLGGLDPSYTGVTLNGMGMASADAFQQANGTDNVRAGGGNRSFGFEQVSINSIESIEINLTTASDQDASSPAGTINLKTKKAFDRKERFIGYSANVMMNSEDPSFKRTYGPGDERAYKIRPGATVDYYDTFLNRRLGIVLNLSESNMYNQQRLVQLGYSTATTATDQRPYVLNSLTFKSGPKFTERFSASLGADYKVSNNFVLSFVSGYQWYSAQYFNRQLAVTMARNNVTGDGLNNFDIVNDGGTVAYGGAQASKLTRSYQLAPSFEYRKGTLTVNGGFNFSTSTNSYGAVARRQNTRDVPVNSLTGLDLRLSRASTTDVDWTVAQIPGTTAASTSAAKDFSNFANYTNPRVVDDGRYNKKNIYQGQLDARYNAAWRFPTVLKAGAKITETFNANDDYTPIYTWAYTGPGGGTTGSWASLPSPTVFDMGNPSVNFVNLSGTTFAPTFANRKAIANLFYDHPEYFANNSTAANWYTAVVGNHRRIREQVNAAYVNGTTRFNQFSFQAGLRIEQTTTTSLDFDPRTGAEVKAAGYTTDSTGRANTVPGLTYQYLSQPQVSRSGDYSNLFPSASAKYSINKNFQAQLGYSHAIRRPNYNDIGGVVTIDENALTINIPNQNLRPEMSDNLVARLAYYFEPVGNLSVSATQNKLKDSVATTSYKSEDTVFGAEYPGYTVFTRSTSPGTKGVKSLTVDYRQNLRLLPGVLRSTTVFFNATRNVVDEVTKYGVPPLMMSGGVSTRWRAFNFGVNAKWTDDTPWNFTVNRFRKERIMTDVNFGYQVSKSFNIFASGRNIFNEADYVYDGRNVNLIQKVEHYGTIWTFGVSGKF